MRVSTENSVSMASRRLRLWLVAMSALPRACVVILSFVWVSGCENEDPERPHPLALAGIVDPEKIIEIQILDDTYAVPKPYLPNPFTWKGGELEGMSLSVTLPPLEDRMLPPRTSYDWWEHGGWKYNAHVGLETNKKQRLDQEQQQRWLEYQLNWIQFLALEDPDLDNQHNAGKAFAPVGEYFGLTVLSANDDKSPETGRRNASFYVEYEDKKLKSHTQCRPKYKSEIRQCRHYFMYRGYSVELMYEDRWLDQWREIRTAAIRTLDCLRVDEGRGEPRPECTFETSYDYPDDLDKWVKS